MDWKARIRETCSVEGQAPDEEVLEELGQHAAAAYETARAEGRTHDEAEHDVESLLAEWRRTAAALKRRPHRAPVVEPPASGAHLLAGLVQDARHEFRLLKREPGFAVVAILTIALGMAATTTLSGIVNGVLLKPLPWPESDRLVRLSEMRQGNPPRIPGTITNATYNAWHEQHSTIDEIAGWRLVTTTAVIGGGEPTRLQTAAVTPTLLPLLKAQPLRGRLFVEDDGRPGGSFSSKDLVILSYGLWQERFGGRDEALGAVVQVGGKPLTVVGIMPRDFSFPTREVRGWTPWAVNSVIGEQGSRRVAIFSALARLKPGATPAQAAAEGTARARAAPDPGLAAVAMFGGNGPAEITATPALEMMTAAVRPALLVLLAAVGLLLTTATANVASLQLARSSARRREMAVRSAIGAAAGRLTRQLIVESALVGLAGGIAGFGLAWATHGVLPTLLPADFPRVDAVAVDVRVVLFVAAVSLLVGTLCGVLPALHARRINLVETLADGGSAPVGSGLRSPTARARTLIIAGQLAVSCVLLVGAALLARSFVALLHVDRGYDPRRLLTARLASAGSIPLERRMQVLETIVGRLRASPGVVNAAFGNALPLFTTGGFRAFKMRAPNNPSTEVDVNTIERLVSPGYFATLGLRLVEGRVLADSDTMSSPEVIVVNRSFAARYLGTPAVGAVVPNLGMCRGDNDRWEVVGVVDDMRQGGVADAGDWAERAQPEIFLPHRQIGCAAAIPDPILVVKTTDDPSPHTAVLRSIVREEAPALALDSVMTMEERVMTTLAKPRLYAVVLVGFGVFAIVIAGVGLFGVLAYSVAQRRREIGVRTALGARPADIVLMVVRQAGLIALAATTVGLWLAFAAAKSLARFLFGVSAHDPVSFAVVGVVVLAASAIACIVPARRAARVDPLTALRS